MGIKRKRGLKNQRMNELNDSLNGSTDTESSDFAFTTEDSMDIQESVLALNRPTFQILSVIEEAQTCQMVRKNVLNNDEISKLCRFLCKENDLSHVMESCYKAPLIKTIAIFGPKKNVLKHLKEWETNILYEVNVDDHFDWEDGIIALPLMDFNKGTCNCLLLITWLEDKYFEPLLLRDTSTSILRLITRLTSSIVCCISENELKELDLCQSKRGNRWESYSLSMKVEQKVNHKDCFQIVATKEKLSFKVIDNHENLCFMKGHHLGIYSQQKEKTPIIIKNETKKFTSIGQLVTWLKSGFNGLKIECLFDVFDGNWKLLNCILTEYGFKDLLGELEKVNETMKKEKDSKLVNKTNEIISSWFDEINSFVDQLFYINIENKEEEEMGWDKGCEFYQKLERHLTPLQIELSPGIRDTATRVHNYLPHLCLIYMSNPRNFSVFVNEQVFYSDFVQLNWWYSVKQWFRKREIGFPIFFYVNEMVGRQFLQQMQPSLISMKNIFLNALGETIWNNENTFHKLKLNIQETDEGFKREWSKIHGEGVAKKRKIQQNYLLKMLAELNQSSTSELKLMIKSIQNRNNLTHVQCMKESKTSPRTMINYQLLNISNDSMFGYHQTICLLEEEEIFKIFTLPKDQLLVITKINLTKYQIGIYGKFDKRNGRLKELSRCIDFCDYDAPTRCLVVGYRLNEDDRGSCLVYKFNENFTLMEQIKTLDLNVKLSICAPFQHLFLANEDLIVINKEWKMQCLNIKSGQMSKQLDHLCKKNIYNIEKSYDGNCLFIFEMKEIIYVEVYLIHEDRSLPLEMISIPKGSCAKDVKLIVGKNQILIINPFTNQMNLSSFELQVGDSCWSLCKSTDEEKEKEENGLDKHWMWIFFHLFEKFPVKGLLESNTLLNLYPLDLFIPTQKADAVERTLNKLIEQIESKLNSFHKKLYNLKFQIHPLICHDKTGMGEEDLLILKHETISRNVQEWFKELICFLPLQICRAQHNSLLLLSDGKDLSQSYEDQQEAYEIAEMIDFGLLMVLLESWQKNVFVMSSMGKQSTGKSYFLNHVTGSSFAISGSRCTDGVWMTLKILDDVLLIILDFEGLGSVERSEQEDVLLSLLNAAISNLTIFRIDMHFSKDIESMFKKFQNGVQKLRGNEHIFHGKIIFNVKDVNPSDQRSVFNEFGAKLENLLKQNKESNFVSEMYQGCLEVVCSPPLGTAGFYDALEFVLPQVQSKQHESFTCGMEFLNCLRLLLAKISILDWTSMDDNFKKLQTSGVLKQVPALLQSGSIPYLLDGMDLKSLFKEEVEAILPHLCNFTLDEIKDMIPQDSEIDLKVDLKSNPLERIVMSNQVIHECYETCMNGFQIDAIYRQTKDFEKLVDAILKAIVLRRIGNVKKWIDQQKIQDTDTIARIEEYYQLFRKLLTRCKHKCTQCFLGCELTSFHEDKVLHDCGTLHVCRNVCFYCKSLFTAGKAQKVESCSNQAGHEGICNCQKMDHTCGEKCYLNQCRNCMKTCHLSIGHKGEHCCSVNEHLCEKMCNAENCHACCMFDISKPHSVHKCAEIRCLHACEMDGCKERCACNDHFHGQEEIALKYYKENKREDVDWKLDFFHMCDNEHPCLKTCEVNGVCEIKVINLKKETKEYSGKKSRFEYVFQEMNGEKKLCCYRLNPYQKDHSDAHCCVFSKQEILRVHSCEERCPCCLYFCDLPFGHDGKHRTNHGNMRNTIFVAEDSTIALNDRKYSPGESGVAEMCNLFCLKMGRGHVHFDNCDKKDSNECVYTKQDGRRHCQLRLEPTPTKSKDEVLHEQFWNDLGWKDPCTSAADQEEFKRCPFQCQAPEHLQDDPSYCIHSVWHDPISPPQHTKNGLRTHTYIDGHQFNCHHQNNSGYFHHIFILDASGSMSGEWDRVLSSVQMYINKRLQIDGASNDIVSLISFSDRADLACEAHAITTVKYIQPKYLGSGTNFDAGLRLGNEVLSRSDHEIYTPVLMFLSDGYPNRGNEGYSLASHIGTNYPMYGLSAFTVSFGMSNHHVLKEVSKRMQGQHLEVLELVKLEETFIKISASIGTKCSVMIK